MAVWSTVSVASAIEADRFDGDYFKPGDLEAIKLISHNGGDPLNSLCTILTGRTPSDYDEGGSLSVVRSGDLVAHLIYPTCERQFLKARLSRDRIKLRRGDLLISSIGMGSIGKISLVVDPADLTTVSEVTILRNAKVTPEYLFAYLASSTGQSQIEREVTGATGQQHLLKSKVGRILIPPAPKGLDSTLRDMVRDAHQQQEAGRVAYAEAEALLESALGLDKLDLTPRLFYERFYANLQAAARFDAEYFSPRMQNLIAALSRDGLTIADVAELAKRRFKPIPGTQYQYIEIADVTSSGMADSSPIAGEDAPSRATWIVKPGDIVTTTVRPIQRLSAIITDEQDGNVCTSGIAVLTPKDIAPELLLIYLRLPLICELLDLYTTASMYPAIATDDLMKIPIVLPDETTRQRIIAKVCESFDARRDARRLLDEAKAMVEEAILGTKSLEGA
jgi:type I restriction enzyme M protein